MDIDVHEKQIRSNGINTGAAGCSVNKKKDATRKNEWKKSEKLVEQLCTKGIGYKIEMIIGKRQQC